MITMLARLGRGRGGLDRHLHGGLNRPWPSRRPARQPDPPLVLNDVGPLITGEARRRFAE